MFYRLIALSVAESVASCSESEVFLYSDWWFIYFCQINFFLLPVNLLRRYKRHFKLPARPGINKAQLADVSLSVYC